MCSYSRAVNHWIWCHWWSPMDDDNRTQKRTGVDTPGDWIKQPDGEMQWSMDVYGICWQKACDTGFLDSYIYQQEGACKCINGVHVFRSTAVIEGLVPAKKINVSQSLLIKKTVSSRSHDSRFCGLLTSVEVRIESACVQDGRQMIGLSDSTRITHRNWGTSP